MLRRIVCVLTLMFVVGCTSSASLPQYRAPQFLFKDPFVLGVAESDVVLEYQSSLQAPFVEHLFPVLPSAAFKQWAKDRVRGDGNDFLLKMVIKDASVRQQDIPAHSAHLFALAQNMYHASLIVDFEVYTDNRLLPESVATVSVKLARSIDENVSVQEREAFFYKMTKDLIRNFDKEADITIPTYLRRYLISY